MKTNNSNALLTNTFAAVSGIMSVLGAAWEDACKATDAELGRRFPGATTAELDAIHTELAQGQNTSCASKLIRAELRSMDLVCTARRSFEQAEREAATGQMRLCD